MSKWPETFSYTLSEAAVCKIPVIVTNIGALGQRTLKNGYGETVPVEEAVEKTIKKLEEYANNKKSICFTNKEAHKTIHEMLNEYNEIYTSINKMNIRHKMESNIRVFNAWIQHGDFTESDQTLKIKISELQRRISKIEGSAAFKVMRKLYDMKIPFKKQVREFILRQK